MIGVLSAFPLPQVLQEKVIAAELEYIQEQSNYFKQLSQPAEITVSPEIYVPVFEPDRATLAAMFIESGAVHLVFKDEVAPTRSLDERYRKERAKIFGRTADVESVEYRTGPTAVFLNNFSGAQPYQTSIHLPGVLPCEGVIYSNTWNHLLSTKPCMFIKLRGGYKKVTAPVMEGDRAAAEEWAASQ